MKLETEETELELIQESPHTIAVSLQDTVMEELNLEIILTKSQVFSLMRELTSIYYRM